MSHFKKICKKCNTVIAQCRCMDCNKVIEYGVCEKCKDIAVDEKSDYTVIKNDRIRTRICDLMSAMLNNPDKHGLFPTSEFMSKMEDYCLELRHEAIGWTWAEACNILDSNNDPRQHDQAGLISDATTDLDKASK